MMTRSLTIRFLTPAFLGDAEQAPGWRTPTIKHALRRWWRVAWIAKQGRNGSALSQMRDAEGRLFGDSREGWTRQSLVRLRLRGAAATPVNPWSGRSASGVAPIQASLDTSHAWFGLIQRGDRLPDRSRLEPGEDRQLVLAYPSTHKDEIDATLRLVNTFATLGTRARGGWGSLEIENESLLSVDALRGYSRPLRDCLQRDWPATLAAGDRGPWVWRSRAPFPSWDEALAQGARWRREVRTTLKGPPDLRKALGFAANGRMPNPLHWKLVKIGGQLTLQVAAFPHALPKDSQQQLEPVRLESAWKQVRDKLDQLMDRIQ